MAAGGNSEISIKLKGFSDGPPVWPSRGPPPYTKIEISGVMTS